MEATTERCCYPYCAEEAVAEVINHNGLPEPRCGTHEK